MLSLERRIRGGERERKKDHAAPSSHMFTIFCSWSSSSDEMRDTDENFFQDSRSSGTPDIFSACPFPSAKQEETLRKQEEENITSSCPTNFRSGSWLFFRQYVANSVGLMGFLYILIGVCRWHSFLSFLKKYFTKRHLTLTKIAETWSTFKASSVNLLTLSGWYLKSFKF